MRNLYKSPFGDNSPEAAKRRAIKKLLKKLGYKSTGLWDSSIPRVSEFEIWQNEKGNKAYLGHFFVDKDKKVKGGLLRRIYIPDKRETLEVIKDFFTRYETAGVGNLMLNDKVIV